jgi:hypothetical protein
VDNSVPPEFVRDWANQNGSKKKLGRIINPGQDGKTEILAKLPKNANLAS